MFSGLELAGIDPDAAGDRIRDVLLGDDAEHVARSGHPSGADNERHVRLLAPHPVDHIEHDIVIAHDREITRCDLTQLDTGVGALEPLADAGVDAYCADQALALPDEDMAHPALVFGHAQESVEAHFGCQHLMRPGVTCREAGCQDDFGQDAEAEPDDEDGLSGSGSPRRPRPSQP